MDRQLSDIKGGESGSNIQLLGVSYHGYQHNVFVKDLARFWGLWVLVRICRWICYEPSRQKLIKTIKTISRKNVISCIETLLWYLCNKQSKNPNVLC